MGEDGLAYHSVFFASVSDENARVVRVADSILTEAGVDPIGDYGPEARPIIEATVDVDATDPEQVLPEDIASAGRLASLDDEFTLRDHYGKE